MLRFWMASPLEPEGLRHALRTGLSTALQDTVKTRLAAEHIDEPTAQAAADGVLISVQSTLEGLLSAISWTLFSTPDDEIGRYVQDMSVPTLMLSCVHMTGDIGILDGPHHPHGLMANEEQGFMSPEEQAAARAFACGVIKDYRDAGCPDLGPVSSEALRRMMSWAACEPIDDAYLPMVLEEIGFAGELEPPANTHAGRDEFPVVIIGCGESGLLAAIRCKQAGIPFQVVEKNAEVGGTWFENTYPGARVDSPNHLYAYSFEPSDHWSEYFSQQPELKRYFEDVAQRHGIYDHIRFCTEVLGARWCEDSATWIVDVADASGTEQLTARALISAVGQLNRPMIPDFPGMADFAGPAFHTARWDHTVDLTGKNVALIGAGASGFQVAPTIADKVKSLKVFQRTAQWMFPNLHYHEPVGAGAKWAMKHLPYYARWYRFLLLWAWCDKGIEPARVDPDWPDQHKSVSLINEAARVFITDWMMSQIEGDDELAAKVIPDYPPMGKRMLQDNGSWLRTLRRPNVTLVRDPVERITADGIETSGGSRHPADLIIFATGFRANDMLLPMTITGRAGIDLREQWGDCPTAYLGITVPGFPNFFCMYGPGTNLASSGSIIFHSECQAEYIVNAITYLADNDVAAAEPKSDITREWVDRSQKEMSTLVWSQPSVKHSFYKNKFGQVFILSPWRVVDYWNWTRRFEPDDYLMRIASHPEAKIPE